MSNYRCRGSLRAARLTRPFLRPTLAPMTHRFTLARAVRQHPPLERSPTMTRFPPASPGTRRRRMSLLSGLVLLQALLAISQAQITLDSSLGPRGPLAGPNYRIGAELGQIRGGNLFHSFDQFDVPTGGSATFAGPHTIANILSRVTGDSRPRLTAYYARRSRGRTCTSSTRAGSYLALMPAWMSKGPSTSAQRSICASPTGPHLR
jgi:hypothetical protein